jgi:hypothetical protein
MSTFLKSKLQLLFCEIMRRRKQQILSQFLQVKGLIPLLMKPRNNQHWTPQDKRELILNLKCLSHMSAYIAVLIMPGGCALLPVMAWWLDRRREKRGVPSPHHAAIAPPGRIDI